MHALLTPTREAKQTDFVVWTEIESLWVFPEVEWENKTNR